MTKRSRRMRSAAIQEAISDILDRLRELEARASDRAPASEIERLNLAFDLIAQRAPASEIERLNLAFDLIAQRALASETDRLNLAFDLIAQRAPASEVERLDYAIDLVANHRPSERVVEVPWALANYHGEARVLEVGYAHAEQHYLQGLSELGVPFLVGLDAAVSPRPEQVPEALLPIQGDLLKDCIRPESFDLILCVSTIEHIGRDNSVYGLNTGGGETRPDIKAIQTMRKWLAPGGQILLTVPFGKYEDRGWLINYDADHLDELVSSSGMAVEQMRFFGWLPGGWLEVDPDVLADRGYQSLGASHAAGVALIQLRRQGNPA